MELRRTTTVAPRVVLPAAEIGFEVRDLPPFPVVATRLLGLLSRPEVGMKELSDLIATDAALTTEVIRMVNSVEWGIRQEVVSVLHALALLGVDRVKGLAFTVAIRNYMSSALHRPSLRACWRHNLACALLSDELARQLLFDQPDAYTAGMLHDIGRLALCAALPVRCAVLFENATACHDDPLEGERQVFGIDHCTLGARLARQWGLPFVFHSVIADHHRDLQQATKTDRFSLTTLIQLSCTLADHLGFGATPAPPPNPQELIDSLPAWELGRLLCDWQEMQFRIACRLNALDPG